jgi:hypothetical protein
MKAISLWEPWASAIAVGAKKIETRSWPTRYRGPLLICASKRTMDAEAQDVAEYIRNTHPTFQPQYGMALCIVTLVDCVPTDNVYLRRLSPEEHYLGNYDNGRWAWITADTVRIIPFPIRGAQGLFDVDLWGVSSDHSLSPMVRR